MRFGKNKKKKKIKGNQKIMNATPTIYNGVKYRSILEAFTAEQLDKAGIVCEYEKNKFQLIDKFESINDSLEVKVKTEMVGGVKRKVRYFIQSKKNILGTTYNPDFVDPKFKWLLECKGYKTDSFDLKWKMFKKYLSDNKIIMELFLPENKTQVLQVIEIIKNKYK